MWICLRRDSFRDPSASTNWIDSVYFSLHWRLLSRSGTLSATADLSLSLGLAGPPVYGDILLAQLLLILTSRQSAQLRKMIEV